MVWECGLNSYCLGQGVVAGISEHGDKYSVSRKIENILTT
jgi:hypothetical protein